MCNISWVKQNDISTVRLFPLEHYSKAENIPKPKFGQQF